MDFRHVAMVCIDPGIPVFGHKGASIHVQSIARAWLARDARVSLLAARVNGNRPAGLESISCREVPLRRTGSTHERELDRMRANDISARLVDALSDLDLVYERYSLFHHGAVQAAKARDVPTVLEVNAPLILEQQRHRKLANLAEATGSLRRALAASDRVIAVSEGVADYLDEFSECHGRVRVVPNGVDPNRFANRKGTRQDGPVRIGFLGSLKPWHGLDDLVAALGRLVEQEIAFEWHVVGDGPERTRIAQAAKSLGIDARFTGAIPPDQVPGELSHWDIGVAPYPTELENYFSPLKVFEYMAAGLAIVATGCGQTSELLEPGRTGLLVEPGDVCGLSVALGRLISDSEERTALGDAARECAISKHSWDRALERIVSGLEGPS